MRLFRHRNIDLSFQTRLYDERHFYDGFSNDLKTAKRSVLVESPFMTLRRAQSLSDLLKKATNRGVEARVYSREPCDHTPELSSQANQAIAVLRSAGVRVFLCDDLRHRKIAVIDDEILWEGSLNILSQSHSREIMRRKVSKQYVHDMLRFTEIVNRFGSMKT